MTSQWLSTMTSQVQKWSGTFTMLSKLYAHDKIITYVAYYSHFTTEGHLTLDVSID